jgi:hypothetical protein
MLALLLVPCEPWCMASCRREELAVPLVLVPVLCFSGSHMRTTVLLKATFMLSGAELLTTRVLLSLSNVTVCATALHSWLPCCGGSLPRDPPCPTTACADIRCH